MKLFNSLVLLLLFIIKYSISIRNGYIEESTYDHHVAIEIKTIFTLFIWKYHCGGSIVSSDFILTAKSCYDSNGIYRIVYNTYNNRLVWTDSSYIEYVTTIWLSSEDDDLGLAMMLVENRLPAFSASQKILLPEKSENLTEYIGPANIIGFGIKSSYFPVNERRVNVGNVTIFHGNDCANSPNFICVFGDSKPCSGDQGGPLIGYGISDRRLPILIGVLSINPSVFQCSDDTNMNSEYLSIFPFIEWAKELIKIKNPQAIN